MARLDELLKYIDPKAKGVEVAPYFNPALPKSIGFDTLVLDVFDTDQLFKNATNDPHILTERIAEIETVDIVGDASNIGPMIESKGLSGQICHIVSSHNFEHLPNPIKFLRGCGAVLKPGGMLSMAVPDCRACFDCFRMPTRLGDWLSAFHANATQPRPETLFDYSSNVALYFVDGVGLTGCNVADDDPSGFQLVGNLRESYDRYLAAQHDPGPYQDAH